ncbi:MAG: hypothetical protein JWN40_4009 [Phycisphaerales bacterium]|nr:hypothetical protein [Phycisphaerales bacterium]
MSFNHCARIIGVASRSRVVRAIFLVVSIVSVKATDVRAGAVSWVKDADGSWAVASNWSSNPTLPTANDDVTINVAGDRLMYVEGTQWARNLTVSERFNLASGSYLNIGGVVRFDNVANLGSGTIRGGTLELGPNGVLTLGQVMQHLFCKFHHAPG